MSSQNKQSLAKKAGMVAAKARTQIARKQRLERAKRAIRDFEAGLISKTELRKRVPRSWFAEPRER